MKKIVWMACGMALMCAPLSASANVRYDDPQEKVQKKEVPNPEKAAQRRTDEMDKALNLTEKQYKKIYKLFLKEEKEKVEAMMQRHPGGMNGLPPMAGRPRWGRTPSDGRWNATAGWRISPGMGGFPEGMSPEERMKEHAEKMQKEQEKREKKIRKILTEEQYATWQTVKPQPQVLPPMPEGERPGLGPRGPEEEEAPLLDTAAE